MAALTVKLASVAKKNAPPADFVLTAVLSNPTDRAVQFNATQAARASLALQVEDPHGKRVLLPPPSTPTAADLAKTVLEPGASVELRLGGFLGNRLAPGRYRVRYHAIHPALGGSPADPLTSEWLSIEVGKPPRMLAFLDWLREAWRRLRDWLCRLLRCRRCRRVLVQEIDRPVIETISDAPVGSEAWNQTFGWNARFQVRIEEAACRIVVVLRIRVTGAVTDAQRAAWKASIENAWSSRFKSCVDRACCANGLAILLDLQYVSSAEHHVVDVTATTAHMNSWSASDTVDVRHEVGHMLGNKEEYFTVDGIPYGPARQPGGNIMNNPANLPVAAHYWLAQETVNALLGETGVVKGVSEAC